MQRFTTAILLAATSVFAGAANLAAQVQPTLTLDTTLLTDSLDTTVVIQGRPGGTVIMTVMSDQLSLEPTATPWGDLFVDPNRGTTVSLTLDNNGTATVNHSFPRPFPDLTLSAQVLGLDLSGQPELLSHPIAFQAIQGNVLAYQGGAYKATATGNAGTKVEIYGVVPKQGNNPKYEELIASGTIQQGKQQSWTGRVPKIGTPPIAPQRIELRIKGKVVAFVVC